MPDTTNQIDVCGSAILNTTVFPDTVLQTLDRRVGKNDLFFGKEMFAKSVRDWNGIPAIYQPDGIHPKNFKAVAEDPAKAAEAIGGRLVGFVSNPRIVIPGGARLMAELDIDEKEQEIVELWQQGKLFPSTAFTANSDGDRLVTPPVPNHVLLFPAKTDVVVPGDPGAFVNTYEVSKDMTKKEDEKKSCNAELPINQTPEPVPPAEVAKAVDELAGEVADKAEDAAELRAELIALKAEIDALKAVVSEMKQAPKETAATNTEPVEPSETVTREVAELKAENEALKKELETLKKQLEDQKATAEKSTAELNSMLADAKFNRILDKLPPGAKATEVQLNTIRKAFDAGDIETLLNSVLLQPRSGATAAEGVPFSQSKTLEKQEGVGDMSRPRSRKE